MAKRSLKTDQLGSSGFTRIPIDPAPMVMSAVPKFWMA